MVRYYLKKVWKKRAKKSLQIADIHKKIGLVFKAAYRKPRKYIEGLKKLRCRTRGWAEARANRIASTAVRRAYAYNYTPHGLIPTEYPKKDVGVCVENTLLDKLKKYITESGLHVHPQYQWLCATPDAYHKKLNMYIEIKYNRSCKTFKKIIAYNYHQLQFQMFCTMKKHMILLIYDGSLTAAILERDEHFINHCLVRLRHSIFPLLERKDHKCEAPCQFIQGLMPLPTCAPNISKMLKRSYKFKLVKLRYIFPNLSLEKENSLLTLLRTSIRAYEVAARKKDTLPHISRKLHKKCVLYKRCCHST